MVRLGLWQVLVGCYCFVFVVFFGFGWVRFLFVVGFADWFVFGSFVQ